MNVGGWWIRPLIIMIVTCYSGHRFQKQKV